jgi:hypothetical protein
LKPQDNGKFARQFQQGSGKGNCGTSSRRKTEVLKPQINHKIAKFQSLRNFARHMNDPGSNMDEFLRKMDAISGTLDSLRGTLDQSAKIQVTNRYAACEVGQHKFRSGCHRRELASLGNGGVASILKGGAISILSEEPCSSMGCRDS